MRSQVALNRAELALRPPPDGDEAVEAARDRFEKLKVDREQARFDVQAAKAAIADGRAQDTRDAGTALAAGRPAPKDRHAAEHAASVAHAEAVSKLEALDVAIDKVGDELAEAVAADRPAWRERAVAELETAHADYLASIAAAQRAADKVALLRSTVEYLDRFAFSRHDDGKLVAAANLSFRGERQLRVDATPIQHNDRGDLGGILAAAAQLTPFEPEPKTSTATGSEAQFAAVGS